MTDKQPVRTTILPSDIDTQGNVTLWDHGPREPKKFPRDTEDQAKARAESAAADARVWHDRYGDLPQPLVMHASDAGQSMAIEPGRYALEPFDIDEGEVEARVKDIQDKRAAALLAVQTVIDRKTAIAEIMSERQAKVTADLVEETPAGPEPFETRPLQPGDEFPSPALAIGDIVREDGHDQDMTVEAIRPYGMVDCTWMVSGVLNRNAFTATSLHKVN